MSLLCKHNLKGETRKGVQMKDELLNKLIASVREGGKILRGQIKPSREFVLGVSKARKARAKIQLAQLQKRTKAT